MSNERRNIIGTMNERESLEAFCEGAKKCASAARELARDNNDPDWADAADILDMMRENGIKLANMKAMTRFETLMMADMKQKPLIV